MTTRPQGLLVDYGGTLVEEVGADVRAGNEWLLGRASYRPPHVTLEQVLERAALVSREVAACREHTHVETPWPALTRLIFDHFGIRFDAPVAELELGFWQASARTRPMPGAREALAQLRESGVAIAVVSNTCFSERVIRDELRKHGLAQHLAFVMVSAEYAIRKPNRMIFETAAARLAVAPAHIWFVGDRLDTDVAGAKAAGMTAVWFQPQGADQVPSQPADLVISRWDDLARHARQSNGRTRATGH